MSVIGIAVIAFIALTLAIGVRTYTRIRGSAKNYYVAGNAMPVAVVGITLCAQAFDANGSMGNASLSFSEGFWMGAVIPIGLAACLFLTGRWFAAPLHRMRLMTLADFYRRRYDLSSETMATVLMAASNVVLVAGNLAGLGLLLQMVFGVGYLPMLIVIALCILTYAVSGGLYATITTSVLQVSMFVVSIVVAFFWLASSVGWETLMAAVPALAGDHPRDRKGLFLGLNAGWGGAAFQSKLAGKTITDDSYRGATGALRFGYAFSNSFALGLEGHGFGAHEGDEEWGLGASFLTVTWWPDGSGFFLRPCPVLSVLSTAFGTGK